MMKFIPALLLTSSLLLLSYCKDRNELEKINCEESFEKFTVSDTSSGRVGVILKNIKKIPDAEMSGDVKNELVINYSSEKNKEVPYSTEFCTQYNALIDIINKEDADRRPNSGLSDKEREMANERYSKLVDSLSNLLYASLNNIIKPPAPGTTTPEKGGEVVPVPPAEMLHVFIKASDFNISKFDEVLRNGVIIAKNRDVFDSHIPLGSVLTFKHNDKIIHQTIVKNE